MSEKPVTSLFIYLVFYLTPSTFVSVIDESCSKGDIALNMNAIDYNTTVQNLKVAVYISHKGMVPFLNFPDTNLLQLQYPLFTYICDMCHNYNKFCFHRDGITKNYKYCPFLIIYLYHMVGLITFL